MSLVTLIRDYADVANSSKQLDGYTLLSLAYWIFAFLVTIIKQAFVYCFTFHWLRDLSYFCLTPPLLLSSFTSVNNIESQPLSNLLAFSDSNFATSIGIVFLGFLNGCSSCLHLSAANLITIQRMLVQGAPAGLCSAFGTAVGQFFFLACVIFGFRGFLFSWLALEPLNFFLGALILLIIASRAAQDRRTPTLNWSAKWPLLVCVCTNVVLAWCEQTAIFQWMGNLSFGVEPTFLETIPSLGISHTDFTLLGNLQFLAQNVAYLFTFFLGNIIGISLLSVGLQRLLELIFRYRGVAIYYGLVKQANLPLATLIFAFGFGSLPYYGFDYLLTKGLGFVPNEHLFQQTLFSPTNLVSKTAQTKETSQGRLEDQLALLFTLEGERSKSFAVDTTPFDNGQYLKSSQKRPQAFEDLNYRGEHLWTNRLSRISNIREQANQTQSSFLGPIFSWMRSFLWGDGPTVKPSLGPQQVPAPPASSLEYSKIHTPNFANLDFAEGTVRADAVGKENALSLLNNSDLSFAKEKIELSPEREHVDNYVKEFNRQFDKGFSNFYNADPQSLIEVEDQWQEKRIKEKCYTNPIYTFLLNTEIDAFLARQPKSHWLSPKEEDLLLKRRQLLSKYYDTLALTSQVSTSEALDQLVPKSYGNAVYNHQFKGTLKTARRLFSIKTAGKMTSENPTNGLLAKQSYASGKLEGKKSPTTFQQSSMGDKADNGSLAFPAQSKAEQGQSSGSSSLQGLAKLENSGGARTVKFDQPLFLKVPQVNHGFHKGKQMHQQAKSIVFHEELNPNVSTVGLVSREDTANQNIFLLEQAEPLPLYASWDQELRKLILTNRFQSRAIAGYTLPFPPVDSSANESESKGLIKLSSYPDRYDEGNLSKKDTKTGVESYPPTSALSLTGLSSNVIAPHFTTWPIPNPLVSKEQRVSTSVSQTRQNKLREKDLSSNSKDVPNSSTTLNANRESSRLNIDSSDRSNPSIIDEIKGFLSAVPSSMQRTTRAESKNRFLFQSVFKEPKESITNDMANALLQWQKLIKDNKQLSKEDKQVAKDKVLHWPENINRANWSNELIDNDIEFDESAENGLKKQKFLWEFIPPNHGGFLWPRSF